jgi:hypothetical protein
MTRIDSIDRARRGHVFRTWLGRACAITGAVAALAGCMADAADDPATSDDPSDVLPAADLRAEDLPLGAQVTGGFDVGIIPDMDEECPVGSDEIVIRMDDEDTANSSAHSDWVGKTNAGEGVHNTRLYFCRVDGTKFKPFSSIGNLGDEKDDYAVLKLDAACPPGSVEFSRHFDNEDGGNANWFQGSIAPNVSAANTTLYFCAFRAAQLGDPIIGAFPSFGVGFRYGVFGPDDFDHGAIDKGTIRTDDEDTTNTSSYTATAASLMAVQRIIEPAGTATVLHVLRAH